MDSESKRILDKILNTTNREYPYPINDGSTHYVGCWNKTGHHNCAVSRVYELIEENKESFLLISEAREAIRLTREYVGEDLLPALPGWSWFDVTQKINDFIDPKEDFGYPTVEEAQGLDLRAEGQCNKCTDGAAVRTVGGLDLCTRCYEEDLIAAVERRSAKSKRAVQDAFDNYATIRGQFIGNGVNSETEWNAWRELTRVVAYSILE